MFYRSIKIHGARMNVACFPCDSYRSVFKRAQMKFATSRWEKLMILVGLSPEF